MNGNFAGELVVSNQSGSDEGIGKFSLPYLRNQLQNPSKCKSAGSSPGGRQRGATAMLLGRSRWKLQRVVYGEDDMHAAFSFYLRAI